MSHSDTTDFQEFVRLNLSTLIEGTEVNTELINKMKENKLIMSSEFDRLNGLLVR